MGVGHTAVGGVGLVVDRHARTIPDARVSGSVPPISRSIAEG
jgi:hypothetical protein